MPLRVYPGHLSSGSRGGDNVATAHDSGTVGTKILAPLAVSAASWTSEGNSEDCCSRMTVKIFFNPGLLLR